MKIKRYLSLILFCIVLISPLVFILLPGDFFDNGKTICLSKRFLDIECLGCGLTRGVQHLLHLDFQAAWEFNKLTFIVFPACIYLWIHFLKDLWKSYMKQVNSKGLD